MPGLPGLPSASIALRNPLAFPATLRPGVDAGHPALNGGARLRLSAVARGGSLVDVMGRQVGTRSGTITRTIDPILGDTANLAAGTGASITFTGPSINETATVGFIGHADAQGASFFSTSTAANNYGISRGSGPSSSYIILNVGGATQNFGPNYLGSSIPYFIAACFSGTSPYLVIRRLDTGALLTQSLTTFSPAPSNGVYTIGDDGPVAAVAYTNAVLSPKQLIAWAYDPWSFWYPRSTSTTIYTARRDKGAGQADGAASVAGVSGATSRAAGTADGAASVAAQGAGPGVGLANGVGSASAVTAGSAASYGVAQGFANAVAIATPFAAAGQADGSASVLGVKYSIVTASLSDSFLLHPDSDTYKKFIFALAQSLSLTPSDLETVKHPTLASLAQALTVAPSSALQWKWGRTIQQALSLQIGQSQKATYHLTDSDTIRLAQALIRAVPVTLSQNLTAHQAHALALAVTTMQRLRLVEALGPHTNYHLSLVQALLMNSALQRFFGAALSQSLTAHAALSRTYVASPVLAQALTVHAALANTLSLRLTGAIDLTPGELLQAIFRGEGLLDGVNLTGLYVSPTGTATTWAINTRTNAVTEYTNYDFKSFTPMGRKYLAADETGVYELNGDDDAGTGIVVEIQSALLQMNFGKLGGLKGVYLAIRGEGQFFLKIISGDSREYTYQVEVQPHMMATKVNVGKGLRMTYFSFNLVSTGQDFDIDGLEFIPMLSDRRV